jgi:hypothetical protein
LYHRPVTLLKKTFPSGAGFWLFFRKGEITLGRYAEYIKVVDQDNTVQLDQLDCLEPIAPKQFSTSFFNNQFSLVQQS